MDNNILLTYEDTQTGVKTYSWFSCEDEMRNFIDNVKPVIIEAVEIVESRQIEI